MGKYVWVASVKSEYGSDFDSTLGVFSSGDNAQLACVSYTADEDDITSEIEWLNYNDAVFIGTDENTGDKFTVEMFEIDAS